MTTRGGQKGNNNAGNAKYARRALEKALRRRDGQDIPNGLETFETLVDIWDMQIGNALAGDKASTQMIVERLDGKPKQEIEQDNKSSDGSMSPINADDLVDAIRQVADYDDV